jgi:hypothetical protein
LACCFTAAHACCSAGSSACSRRPCVENSTTGRHQALAQGPGGLFMLAAAPGHPRAHADPAAGRMSHSRQA